MNTGLYKSVALVRALVGTLARADLSLAELLRGTNIPEHLLSDYHARISLAEWNTLVHNARVLSADPGIGITMGNAVPENMVHVVSQIAVACGTLREAMRMLDRYHSLLGNTQSFDLLEEGDRAYFVCTPLYAAPHGPEFETELSLSLVYRIYRRFIGESEDALEVWFTHPAPPYAERYAEVFRCPLHFARPRNAILAPRRHLDQLQVYASPLLVDVLREGADRMLAEQATPTLSERVRTMLRHETDLSHVHADQTAKRLGLNGRALRRRLIQANTSWSSLLDEARRQIACDELRVGNVSIGELAQRLGFSDSSAFNRAFRRWTGMTPTRYSQASRTEHL